ncbi:MAG: 2-dehydro-3-deoxyphosphogluconate aldolase [Spirochaetae bacterium HGW-Spirochaetae-1]|jgi:2-dehydro-3-deoxyphosphogluconate aldolase/(4S)-4-hydroxy-2-oxoglutarate aldolase|nr:MAG: 2-dehydro-3-deoxyphosphogluconate aldolase [Spirochaetae bacterium HGW-Spirochaetae-1]
MELMEILRKTKIIPVAVLENTDDACRVAELLLKHDLSVIEVTLRTENALKCITAVVEKFPEMSIGAGSVLSKDGLRAAQDGGARFAVSPGLDVDLLTYARTREIPFVPGIATPSEIIKALEFGSIVKIFPAAALGGIEYINAIAAPFKMKELHLMPTGGVNAANFMDYLKADRVIACGMTYIVDGNLLREKNYREIERRIEESIRRRDE